MKTVLINLFLERLKRKKDKKTKTQKHKKTKTQKEEKTDRQKDKKRDKDKDQRECLILRRQGSFALLRCFYLQGTPPVPVQLPSAE